MKSLWRIFLCFFYKTMIKIQNQKNNTKKLFISYVTWFKGFFNRKKIFNVEVKTLVICAHPDDETIFFSSVLESEKPYVICMSHCGNSVRRDEFYNALKFFGVNGVMLNAPDITIKSRYWQGKRLLRLIKKIKTAFPNVTVVYTHNAVGESKHMHHHGLGKAVKAIFDCKIFFTAEKPDDIYVLPNDKFKKKQSVMNLCYVSQLNMLNQWCDWYPDYMRCEGFEEG